MAILPFRGLAAKGILKDPSAFQLDLNAFSDGSNVRFHTNKAMRSPVFQTAQDFLATPPVFCTGRRPSTGDDTVVLVSATGTVSTYANGGVVDVTPYGSMMGIHLEDAGSGYSATYPPTLTIAAPPPGGVQAVGTVVVEPSGAVSGVILSHPGSGYTAPPAVTIGAPGVQATFVALLTGNAIGAIQTTNPGLGYNANTPPTVTVTAAPTGGTTAVLTPLIVNGQLSLEITNPGAGYLTAPTITVGPPPETAGTQASAAAVLWSTATSNLSFTSTFMGDVTYLNQPGSFPLWYGPNSVNFQGLPMWDASWSCRALRAYSDYVIALNVTKGETTYANMVKWSDLTLDGQPPDSWDADDPTTSAGENPIDGLTTPLVDGLALRSVFVLYSSDQIWAMQPSGDQNIFYFAQLFSEGGLLSPNCAAEVDGRHYVFGPYDIYQHDGVSKMSIIDNRNREYLYGVLNRNALEACFAVYMPKFGEVMFGFNSVETNIAFPNTPGVPPLCNRAAVYSITGDTWSFIDLPNVGAVTTANLTNSLTYATVTATYETISGNYASLDGAYIPTVVACSSSYNNAQGQPILSASRVFAYDFRDHGDVSYPFCPEANGQTFLERTGLSLDQEGSDLTTYKVIRRVYPQVTIYENVPLTFQIGASLTPSGPVTWGPPMTYNPVTDYKLDCRIGGRYLAIRVTETQPVDWEFEGFDIDVVPGGSR